MSEQGGGGRYQRSAGGLVGAMILTVVLVIGFVLFRGVFSDDVDESDRPAVDYLANVEQLQGSGITVVHPETLPEGWRVTGVDVDPVERPGAEPDVGFDLLTDGDDYVGIKLVDDDADDVLEEFLDEDPQDDEPLIGTDSVATDWEGWQDEGGDHAFTAPYGDRTLLVFGAVDPDELADVIGRLSDTVRPGVTPPAAPSS